MRRSSALTALFSLFFLCGFSAGAAAEGGAAEAPRDLLWEATSGPEGAAVFSMVATPLGTVLAGTENGGLYRSTDGGMSWMEPGGGLEWPCCNYNVRALEASASAVYAGTWGGGVHRSDDDGESWYATGSIPDEGYPIVLALAACFRGERVYAGGQFSVARSDDGGGTWALVNDGLPSSWIRGLALRGTTLYAMSDGGVYRLDQGSTTWAAWNDGLNSVVAQQSLYSAAECLYLATHDGGVWHLDCDDSVWVAMNDGLYDDNVDVLAETDLDLYAGLMGGGVYRWNPGTWSWEDANDGLWNWDVRWMTVLGLDLFAGTYGAGVFALDTSARSWTWSSGGMTSAPVLAIAADGANIYAGVEGGGVFRSADQGDTWEMANDGIENVFVHVLAAEPGAVYAGTWNGIYKTVNAGISWTAAGLQGNGIFGLDFLGGVLHAGTHGGEVWSSEDGGGTWDPVGSGLPGGFVRGIAERGDTLFASVDWQGVFRLPDGGSTWDSVNTGLPERMVRCLSVSDGALFAGIENRGVYRWDGAAEEWDTTGLGWITVFSLTDVGTELLAGSWGAIHSSSDTGRTWTDASGGLKPWVAVHDVEAGGTALYAGLIGAGVFRADYGVGVSSPVEEAWFATGLSVRPNPSADGSRIAFRIDRKELVQLNVYDVAGRRVASLPSRVMTPGAHEVRWDGRLANGEKASPGVYFIRLKAGEKELHSKTIVLR
ncbi:MAG: FlgD immunoglobulin-like domain containing protein [Candidatus Eisenbacteria bacterium]